jgi:exoribonuclease-2
MPPFDLLGAARRTLAANGFAFDDPPPPLPADAPPPPAPQPADAGLRDMRDLLWSSIDNAESRDLDQVEVAEPLPDGAIRVHVGIADVDALVPRGSPVDEYARRNATSVYTGPAVFAMLPEALSTDATSLLDGAERLAVVVTLEVDAAGVVRRHDACRARVRNRAKLVYEDVGAWLDGGGGAPPAGLARVPGLEAQLRLQREAARRLKAERLRAGALEFDTVEARPVTRDGHVVDLELVRKNLARDLIEDFMIASNVAIARFLESHGSSGIRRVVREPERWNRIVAVARSYGDTLPDAPDSLALAGFLSRRRAADPERFPDLSTAIVKLLGPGIYALDRPGTDPGGHFGLAAHDYAHATAPNRRYADLVTQRLVKAVLAGAPQPYADDELAAIAAHCTEREDAARKVERVVRKMAAAELLGPRVGETFDAIVTGETPKGTFVRLLHPPAEGRVVRGEAGMDVGDRVRVRLVAVDPALGHVDFAGDGEPAHAR